MDSKEKARFKSAIVVILKHEGGLTNDPRDPGGITNFGITLPFLKEYYKKMKLIKKGAPLDIRNLTRDKAEEIYRVLLWEQFKYNLLDALPIATKVFDMAVNMGYTRAHKLLQKAINNTNKDCPKIAVDGVLGPITRHKANLIEAAILHDAIRFQQRQFYYQLVDQRPNMKWALVGWINRASW